MPITGMIPIVMPMLTATWNRKIDRHAIAVDPSERFHLALAHADQTQDQDREQHDDGQAAQKAPFLADGAEDEVGALLGHEIELSLRPLQKALAAEAARAYSYFRLIHVVSPVLEVRPRPSKSRMRFCW